MAQFASKTADSARDQPIFVLRKLSGPTFLDLWRVRGFNARNLRKDFFSTRRPAREAGGQRPTARCALGRKSVWFGVLALRQHILARHHPPPGLAFGEPDDRLQRAGMTAVTDDLILRSRAAASRRMGNDTTSPFETQAAPAPQGEAAGRLKCSTICRKSLAAYSI